MTFHIRNAKILKAGGYSNILCNILPSWELSMKLNDHTYPLYMAMTSVGIKLTKCSLESYYLDLWLRPYCASRDFANWRSHLDNIHADEFRIHNLQSSAPGLSYFDPDNNLDIQLSIRYKLELAYL